MTTLNTDRAMYTIEFEQEAVRLGEAGQTMVGAVRSLSISDQTLFRLGQGHRQGELTGVDSKPVSAEQMEISRLHAAVGSDQDGARYPEKSDGVLRDSNSLRYAFILIHRLGWLTGVQCRVLSVSVSVSVAGFHER